MKNYFFRIAPLCFFIILLFLPRSSFSAPVPAGQETIEYLEFREVDIKDVLRQLAKQYNLNIIFSQAVTGPVTVQLNNVSLDEALDSIITVNGFVYSKKGGIIKVSSPDEAQKEGKQSRLFKLNNAEAARIRETLSKVLSPDGSIDVNERSNAILVTDTLAVINKIEAMLPSLDELTLQVLIETKFIETRLESTEKLGIDWTTTMSVTGSKRTTTLPFSAKDAGSWNKNILPTAGSGVSPAAYAFPYAAATDFVFGTLDFSKLSAVFDFLKTRTNTRLVANPRIVTLNNQKATIHVGQDVPLPTYERNDTTGVMEITGWSGKEKIGVNLEVTPQISPAGYIKLKIKPEVSSIDKWMKIEGDDAAPITITRTAETEVQIKDGQTVVIGGLVKEQTYTKVNKIPILGDIPLIGFLFTRKEESSTSTPTEKTDLLIFVTARIIKDNNESLLAWGSDMVIGPLRPLKLGMKEIK